MLRKLKGVVLNQIKYGDTSVIAKIYTREEGLQSFIIKGAKSKKKKVNFLQALFLVEVESSAKSTNTLQFTKEITPYQSYSSIPFDIIKSTIVLFIAEILTKSLKEEEKNEKLYDFIESSLVYFDNQKSNYSNFHLSFIIHLTKYLGFNPNLETYKLTYYFNLAEGCFTFSRPENHLFISDTIAELFYSLCNIQIEDSNQIEISKQDKQYLLEKLMDYYSTHLEGFGRPKSLQVLKEVFS